MLMIYVIYIGLYIIIHACMHEIMYEIGGIADTSQYWTSEFIKLLVISIYMVSHHHNYFHCPAYMSS
jgi:hypothetical protein